MHQKSICYAPHRVSTHAPLYSFLFSLLPWICLVLFCFHRPISNFIITVLFAFGVVGNYVCKVLHDANSIQIILDEQHLQCISMNPSGYQAFSWEALSCGYLNQVSQGNAYLILSNNPVDPKYIKKQINLSLYSRIRQDKNGNIAVFLSLPPKADRDAVLAYISSKIDIQKIN